MQHSLCQYAIGCRRLCRRKATMRTDLWRLERQHDAVAWRPRRHKFFRHAAFRPIILNPDLFLADILELRTVMSLAHLWRLAVDLSNTL